MEVHGNLDLKENVLQNAGFGVDINFPTDPKPGRIMFKDKIVYYCAEIAGGLPVWIPISQPLNLYKHNQSVEALEWTVNHNLNSTGVIVQVYDSNGKWVVPDIIDNSVLNKATISFSTPMAGFAVVLGGVTEGAAQPLVAYTADFTNSAVWVVNHNLGYNPIVHCIIGQSEVQPGSISYDSLNRATVTFDQPQTGSVRCI